MAECNGYIIFVDRYYFTYLGLTDKTYGITHFELTLGYWLLAVGYWLLASIRCVNSRCRVGIPYFVKFALLAALLALTDALHLALYAEFVLTVGLAVIDSLLEFCEFLACQTGQFLVGLSLLDGAYGILNHGVGVLDKLISLLLGLTYD